MSGAAEAGPVAQLRLPDTALLERRVGRALVTGTLKMAGGVIAVGPSRTGA